MRVHCELEANLVVDVWRVDPASGLHVIDDRKLSHNIVTLAARNKIRDMVYGDTVVLYILKLSLGSGVTPETEADVAMEAEIAKYNFASRVKDDAMLTLRYYMASTEGNGYTYAEAGLLTAETPATLYARATYTPILKSAAIALTYSWELSWTVT